MIYRTNLNDLNLQKMKTEINVYVIFAILFIHWLADFVLQTSKMAESKSTSNYWLTAHVLTYTAVWFIACLFYCAFLDGTSWTPRGIRLVFDFPIITFICHWITDYSTSRLNTKLLPKREEHPTEKGYFKQVGGSIHYFFVSIGGDQILHYVQLIVTFQLLSQC